MSKKDLKNTLDRAYDGGYENGYRDAILEMTNILIDKLIQYEIPVYNNKLNKDIRKAITLTEIDLLNKER